MTRLIGSSRSGFTLVEVLTVVVVLAILAAAVAPGFGSMRARSGDAAEESIRGMLHAARATASASGTPTGVEIDTTLARVRLVQYLDGAVSPAPGVLGVARKPVWISRDFAGTSIVAITLTDGSAPASGVLWFGFDGMPQLRDEDGSLVGLAASEGIIDLGDGREIRVDPVTGVLR